MSKFIKFASITKKVTLALLGMFLMIFLLMHLGINLCMLRPDHGAWFRAAAHFMGTNYIIKVFEIVLFGTIFLHIALGITLQVQNWLARPVRYKVTNKSKASSSSKTMIWTGGLVLCFLALHLVNFYFVKLDLVEGRYMIEFEDVHAAINENEAGYDIVNNSTFIRWNEETPKEVLEQECFDNLSKSEIVEVFGSDFKAYEPDFYTMAKQLFSNWLPVLVYVILLIALGLHLNHAFQSSFQTLGWAHSKYTPAIKIISTLYAIVVSVGFMIIPLYMYFVGV